MTPSPLPVQPGTMIDINDICLRLAGILGRAEHLLSRAEEGLDATTAAGLPARRLAPDMLSLAEQVVVLADSLMGAAALMTGRDADAIEAAAWVFNRGAGLGDVPNSIPQARHRLAAARLSVLELAGNSLLPTMQEVARPLVVARAGHVRRFQLAAFVHDYVLPNAYFHLTVIHALLRQAGVSIGKQDYEGPRPYTLN